MEVEIWSDVVCPWCYIGKRRFEAALREFEHQEEVEVRYRSFELDPSAPDEAAGGLAQRLADKYGVSLDQARAMNGRVVSVAREVGLEYRLDAARPGNTAKAHRLLHLAREQGLQADLKERLMAAYFTENEPIGDTDSLVRLAAEVGLDAGRAQQALADQRYLDLVRADEEEAKQLGITGVPFFVLDRRLGVSGAQPEAVMLAALRQAWEEARPQLVDLAGPGDACEDGSCEL